MNRTIHGKRPTFAGGKNNLKPIIDMFEKRKQSQHAARHSADRPLFVCGILHRRNTVRKKPLIQSADCRHHSGHAVCQQLAQQAARNLGSGIKFCTKQILRAGIVLYGFRLTLTQVAAVGLPAVIIDTIIVAGTIFFRNMAGKIAENGQGHFTDDFYRKCHLRCGRRAWSRACSEMRRTQDGHCRIYGRDFRTISMFLYPIMYRTGILDGLTDTGVAIYTGSTLHEVAHVAGSRNAMDPTDTLGIAGTATITKMIRVMMLAPYS